MLPRRRWALFVSAVAATAAFVMMYASLTHSLMAAALAADDELVNGTGRRQLTWLYIVMQPVAEFRRESMSIDGTSGQVVATTPREGHLYVLAARAIALVFLVSACAALLSMWRSRDRFRLAARGRCAGADPAGRAERLGRVHNAVVLCAFVMAAPLAAIIAWAATVPLAPPDGWTSGDALPTVPGSIIGCAVLLLMTSAMGSVSFAVASILIAGCGRGRKLAECRHCGYSLEGLPIAAAPGRLKCPECGEDPRARPSLGTFLRRPLAALQHGAFRIATLLFVLWGAWVTSERTSPWPGMAGAAVRVGVMLIEPIERVLEARHAQALWPTLSARVVEWHDASAVIVMESFLMSEDTHTFCVVYAWTWWEGEGPVDAASAKARSSLASATVTRGRQAPMVVLQCGGERAVRLLAVIDGAMGPAYFEGRVRDAYAPAERPFAAAIERDLRARVAREAAHRLELPPSSSR